MIFRKNRYLHCLLLAGMCSTSLWQTHHLVVSVFINHQNGKPDFPGLNQEPASGYVLNKIPKQFNTNIKKDLYCKTGYSLRRELNILRQKKRSSYLKRSFKNYDSSYLLLWFGILSHLGSTSVCSSYGCKSYLYSGTL